MAWTYDPFLYDPSSFMDVGAMPESNFVFKPLEQDDDSQENEQPALPEQPSIQFARDTWWDALLGFYTDTGEEPSGGMRVISLTQEQRNTAMKSIVSDLLGLASFGVSGLDPGSGGVVGLDLGPDR